MSKREIYEQIIINLLSNKYKDKEINEDLIIEIGKETSDLLEKVCNKLKSNKKQSGFIEPRF
jgi:hypothetical protein